MLELETYASGGRFDVRSYLVVQLAWRSAVMIDPTAESVDAIKASLARSGARLEHVVLTHEHSDHITGVEALRQIFGARLICTRACSDRIQKGTENLSRYLFQGDIVCGPADLYTDDLPDGLAWADTRFNFVPTPGHSPGSQCFDLDGMLFSGDTLLQGLRTVTKLPGGSRSALAASVDRLLSLYPPETRVFPGHGAPFRLDEIQRGMILGSTEQS